LAALFPSWVHQVSAELLAFHADVHAALAGGRVQHWDYPPGNWIPHCALAEKLGNLEGVHSRG
jgi:hypothetical protein